MCEDEYGKRLAYFKENEKPEVVLLIADDPYLIKIVIAWTNTAITHKEKLSLLKGYSEREVWQWLWDNAVYSREDLIANSSVPDHGFAKRLTPLIGNHVLYPDGTINTFVQRYLRDRVLKLFETKPKRPTKKS